MDINTLSVSELKALAYDQIAQKEQAEKNLQLINQMITEKNKEMGPTEADKEAKPKAK